MRTKYNIKTPIWDGRHVGIADFRVRGRGEMELTISYRNVDGNLEYPYTYIMDFETIRSHRTQKLGNGITLYVVPISEWEVLGGQEAEITERV